MELQTILAVVGIILSILMIRYIENISYSGFVPLGDLGKDINLLFAGLPLTLFVIGLFVIVRYFYQKTSERYEKLQMRLVKLAIILQWLLWSQLIALIIHIL